MVWHPAGLSCTAWCRRRLKTCKCYHDLPDVSSVCGISAPVFDSKTGLQDVIRKNLDFLCDNCLPFPTFAVLNFVHHGQSMSGNR